MREIEPTALRTSPRSHSRWYPRRMSTLPIVCDLSAAELTGRRDGLLARLAGSATEISEIENGVVLVLATSPEITGLIAQVIDAERQCCRFLRFRCIYEPDLGPISLEVTGPEGSREFLAEVLGLWRG